MTVKELIAELQKFPEDLPVKYGYDLGYDYYDVNVVRTYCLVGKVTEVLFIYLE